MLTWVGAGQKLYFFVQKSWFSCNSKYFRQNIVTPCYSCYFCIFYILNFFQIIMVSLFLALHDQYLIMFKDSNVFEFNIFSFQAKYNNTVVFSVNSNYLFSRRKQEKDYRNKSLIKSTVYLLIFRQKSMNFEESPNSLMISYFTGEVRLGKS